MIGDAFNFWYDRVICDLKRKKKCVDDVVGWAESLTELFWDSIDFFDVTGNYGIVQNPKKFCWGRRELEFVGFWLKSDGVRPTEDTLKAVSEFSRPSDNGNSFVVWLSGASFF